MENNIQVVFSPALLPYYEVRNHSVVVIDILRATTSMCVAFQTGVSKILPVSTIEECRFFRDFDFLCAAERDAIKVEGFDLGNSPFEFLNPLIAGKKIAFTTTNGTKAIKMAKEQHAAKIYIGSFLNIDALCNKLIADNKSVVLLCAGWKDKFNLEDSLFAGAVVSQLKSHFNVDCDAALSAEILFQSKQQNLENIVRQSSHAKRFTLLHMQSDDVAFCLQQNTMDIVPEMIGEYISI